MFARCWRKKRVTDSKVIVITGTRKGIGRYLAEYYLKQGWTVAGTSREPSDLRHDSYVHYCADVADETAARKLFMDLAKRFGRLDALLNNAGIASMNHVLLTPMRTVEKIIQTNYIGTFLYCREAAKLMQKRRRGRIVNFATVATPLRLEGEACYAASKAAVESLTQVLARELAEFGITVNAVGPTPVPTDLIRSVPKAKMDALLARQAIRRFGEMSDISNVTDFFLREESGFITGQILFLGGC
jgi:3-oxoacyl-[acyl-carrier protein] reductase